MPAKRYSKYKSTILLLLSIVFLTTGKGYGQDEYFVPKTGQQVLQDAVDRLTKPVIILHGGVAGAGFQNCQDQEAGLARQENLIIQQHLTDDVLIAAQ